MPTPTPPQTPAASPSDLPPIAAKADDLDLIKKAVDEAASVGGGLWLSYLFVLLYLAVAAGAVTHVDLFLENPVKLPFLNVELPLLAFFLLAPILFLFVHAYTLVHLVFLADKARRFDRALSRQIGDDSVAARDADDPRIAAIAGLRGQLPSSIFIQFLAGPRDHRAGSFGWLLRVIAWSTLAVAPILLLLLFQLQFLPFHNSWITWSHRGALVVDLVLLWWLWRKILSRRDSVKPRDGAAWAWRGIGALLTAFVVLFSWVVATFPGETEHDLLAKWDASGRAVWLRDRIFQSPVDDTTRKRVLPVSNTLVLTGFNIYEGLKIDDPDKLKGRDFLFLARGRALERAMFDLTTLAKVDFAGAKLLGASFKGAKLDGSSFAGATLVAADLVGTSFGSAQLQGATLENASLQGASLGSAGLQGASLENAQLEGASFESANLQGASLAGAQLQGASLGNANLQSASLERADLQNASFGKARLDGASLGNASLGEVQLDQSQLQVALHRPRATRALPTEVDGLGKPAAEPGVDDAAYSKALALSLKTIVCSGHIDAINVLRGLLGAPIAHSKSRLEATGPAAPELIDFITSKNCPVSAALTAADHAALLQIKNRIMSEATKIAPILEPADAPNSPR
ncbi:MAG TPA: pentapeptide repeat-containing protein [Roseiarcus sp.]